MFVNEHHDDRDKCVPLKLIVYHISVHKIADCTLAEMMLGYDLRLPVDLVCGQPEDKCQSLVTEYVESLQIMI